MNRRYIFIIFIMAVMLLLNALLVHGAILTVSTVGDNAAGSLRTAITTANTNGEDNVIYLPAGTYVLTGANDEDDNGSGDLDIFTSNRLTIIGDGPGTTIIDGNQADRVFHILSGEVSISNVTVQNGKAPDGGPYIIKLAKGGGIVNTGTLTLTDCVVSDNKSGFQGGSHHHGGSGGNGGGIYNEGTLTLIRTVIHNNQTSMGGVGGSSAGSGGDGGGIANTGTLTISSCTISNNRAGNGSTSEEPGSGGDGGGICSSGTCTITNSTISGNRAGDGGGDGSSVYLSNGGRGGGIYLIEGKIDISHSTVSGNASGSGADDGESMANAGYGGGIAVDDGDMSIFSCTICGNFTGEGGEQKEILLAIDNGYGGGIYNAYGGEVTISNTIVADNHTTPVDGEGPDCYGTINSNRGYNLIENSTGCTLIGTTTGNITGVDPLLGVLRDNGGFTETHALLEGSPAIDAGYGYGDNYTDQRGYARDVDIPNIENADKGVDIGAFEYNASVGPVLTLDRTILTFSADTSGTQSGSQTLTVSNGGSGSIHFYTSEYEEWLSRTPMDAKAPAVVTVTVDPTDLTPGTYVSEIEVHSYYAYNSPQYVTVVLNVYSSGTTAAPFGTFETPLHNSTVMSSVPVTGWVIDDIGIENVKIYRDPLPGEAGGLLPVGDAVMVEGARPDIAAQYRAYPNSSRAGWGYMMLTNFLPNQGNGTFTFHAIATDKEGYQVSLGSKTVFCDNAHAVKPFGAIDTPEQGGIISGEEYINFGWVLTPRPNAIPMDGSTIEVWVDGVSLGNPFYNVYREDLAALFPGYANSNGALGYFYLDTTQFGDGVHTIAWSAVDDAGNSDGIGSRYFTIQNAGAGTERTARETASGISECSPGAVAIKTGYNKEALPREIIPETNGMVSYEVRELERVEIHFPGRIVDMTPLPVGATLDRAGGIIYWQTGPGIFGNHQFIVTLRNRSGKTEQRTISINIVSKFE